MKIRPLREVLPFGIKLFAVSIFFAAIFFIIIFPFIPGCSGNTVFDKDIVEKAPFLLPTNAVNVQNIGNDWLTFDLEIEGKTHTFLYQRDYGGKCGYQAITEICSK